MDSSFVVVDGSNIATEGRSTPSLDQLDDAVRQFQEQFPDLQVIVVVDATFGHRIDPSERAAFDEAVAHAEIVSPPAGAIGRGDAFLLRVAERVGAQVLSNDSFQEFHGEHPWLFSEGRLIGGTPVPGVGWIFTPRNPVRGGRSRASIAAADQITSDSPSRATRKRAGSPLEAAEAVAAVTAEGQGSATPSQEQPAAAPSPVKKAKKTKKTLAREMLPDKRTAPEQAAPKRTASKRTAPEQATLKKSALEQAAPEKTAPKKAAAIKKVPEKKTEKKAEKKTQKKSDTAKKALPEKRAATTALTKPASKMEPPGLRAEKVQGASPTKVAAVRGLQAPKIEEQAKPTKKAPNLQQALSPKRPGAAAEEVEPEKTQRASKTRTRRGGRGRRATGASVEEAIEAATEEVLVPGDPVIAEKSVGAGRRRHGGLPPAVNDPLTFLTFVTEHPVGAQLEGTVSSFTSHGAMVDVGDMHCYVPAAGLGDPALQRAREVLDRGEKRSFVLVALDPSRRGAELALPGKEPGKKRPPQANWRTNRH